MKKIFLLLTLLFTISAFAKEKHPYHVGSVEFKYNQKIKTFEVSAKFFLDDLENALNEKYGKAVHFNDKNFKEEINQLLKNYCEEYLKLKVNNQFIKLNYLGFEEDQESVDIYLESAPVENPKKVETAVSFLYNYFDDQLNIIHIVVNGVRKSSKLNYPNRYLFQEF
ncbi:DUF6702 family protein [Halpernia sp.]|uniref:DUF6702 family protein n=1 Tax=Halpernia sp. TaxID=2782209 RepID=UPI003A90BB6B